MGNVRQTGTLAAGRQTSRRLVFVAPRSEGSGVGSHADRLVAELALHVDELVDLRCGGAGEDSIRDCIRLRRRVSAALGAKPDESTLHVELSGGSVAPFWALVARRGVRRSAIVHEPPRPVWAIFRFRFVARHRLLDNAMQWTLALPTEAIERRGLRHTSLVTTTSKGARELAARGYGCTVREARLMPRAFEPAEPPSRRPLAVGLFGHVYGGKGFDLLDDLRDKLDGEIAIVVAGVGTERLRPRRGITFLGPVYGEAEQQFFAGIRLLLLPYSRKAVWSVRMRPASGAFIDAAAHRTPCLTLGSAGLQSLADSGCTTAASVSELTHLVSELINDAARLDRMADQTSNFHSRQSARRTIEPILAAWDSQ